MSSKVKFQNQQINNTHKNGGNTFFNIANLITLLRLFCVPIIVVLLYPGLWKSTCTIIHTSNYQLTHLKFWATIIFVIATSTDWLDGWIARHYNQITNFGKFFDAVADKMLTNTVIILFLSMQILPLWIGLILILRDFCVDIIRQILATHQIILEAKMIGKITTIIKMFGLTILFVVSKQNIENKNAWNYISYISLIPMYITTILALASLTYYIYFWYQKTQNID